MKHKRILLFFMMFFLFVPADGPISASTGLQTATSSTLQWTTTLDNGMKIVIIEDHSSPLAACIINIRAGSHTETLPINGISHLLEHLLFDGTTTYSATGLRDAVESQGGYINAYTRKDCVSFELVMPATAFMDGLAIQADQLLNSTIPETELARERQVVCEEIATDIRDASAAADAELWKTIFGPIGYGLPVIGNYQTVTDVSRERIVAFYSSRYIPSRMTAVVIGDVEPHSVLNRLRLLYGGIAPGLEHAGPGSNPRFPSEGLRSVVERPVDDRFVILAFPAPAPDDPAFLPFRIAVDLWAGSPDSPFQQALDSLAIRPSAYVSPHTGFSLLQLSLSPSADRPDTDQYLADIESAVVTSIRTFLQQSPTDDALMRRVKQERVDRAFACEKFHHLAREIGEHAAMGSLEAFWNLDRALDALTPEAVMNPFRTWVGDRQPVSVMVIPSGTDASVGERIDSTQLRELSNGLTVIARFDPYADMTTIHLLTPNPGTAPPGIPRMVADMLDGGTVTMPAAELRTTLDRHGIRLKLADWAWLPFDDYYDSTEYNYLRMECLSG
ncbi:insulinase family protein, partial [bacterium]|nr:insulinase family protein [candidate division CSSED10-310 bacterium]